MSVSNRSKCRFGIPSSDVSKALEMIWPITQCLTLGGRAFPLDKVEFSRRVGLRLAGQRGLHSTACDVEFNTVAISPSFSLTGIHRLKPRKPGHAWIFDPKKIASFIASHQYLTGISARESVSLNYSTRSERGEVTDKLRVRFITSTCDVLAEPDARRALVFSCEIHADQEALDEQMLKLAGAVSSVRSSPSPPKFSLHKVVEMNALRVDNHNLTSAYIRSALSLLDHRGEDFVQGVM